jgi:primosomal protein N' (replication factor Y)
VGVVLDIPLPGVFDYEWPFDTPAQVGESILVPWARRTAWAWVWDVKDEPASGLDLDRIRAVLARVPQAPLLPAQWRRLIEFASRYYQHPLGACVADALPKALKVADRDHGAQLALKKAVLALQPNGDTADAQRTPVTRLSPDADRRLNAEQSHAVADIRSQAGFSVTVLHGVTGSGKTEVYLQCIAHHTDRGGQCLLLLPEINLTPQVEQYFAQRLPGIRVGTLHSGLSDGMRLKNWMLAQSGQLDLVIATRLGVFTPLPRLSLVLVDEEHDPSYKQMEGLKYSARDLAVMLARLQSCPVVLGSATPSLETWHRVQTQQYRLLCLRQRAVAGAVLPQVELVDTRHHPTQSGLAKPVVDAITDALAQGDQALVFLNRRGYAPTLMCQACGWVAQCHQCSAHTVWHRADRQLRCHHCGACAPVPKGCPTCGNQDLTAFGRGTQRLEESLQAAFPAASILRIDADTTRGKGGAEQAFKAAHGDAVDILVGTQMVAKGHDFQRVKVVVALNVDASLFSHQPRSAERLFAQLMQVSGRAGRAGGQGRFLVQTGYPHHPLFESLLGQDYEGFARHELDARRQAGFAPFMYQALVRADHRKLDQAMGFLLDARQMGLDLLKAQDAEDPMDVFFCDPVPLTVVRVANVERAQLLVESPSRAQLQAFLQRWLMQLWTQRGSVRWFVDVDPIEI